jgi:hypothetical protein
MNNPDNYFPELNIPFLKHFVRYQIIKKKFDSLSLKKVVLYRYFSEYFPNVARKYVISFELGINRNELKAALARRPRIWRKIVDFDVQSAYRGKQTIVDQDYLHQYWGLDDPFRAVYRNGPTREDFLIEWFPLVKFPNEEMPLGVKFDQPHVTLYDSSEKKGKGQDEKKKKKLRPCQQDRLAVQEIAMDIIKKEPGITKAALSKRQELVGATSKPYEEKTFYGWIKDLLPDRKGGRPPKKSPAVKNKQKITVRKVVNKK